MLAVRMTLEPVGQEGCGVRSVTRLLILSHPQLVPYLCHLASILPILDPDSLSHVDHECGEIQAYGACSL